MSIAPSGFTSRILNLGRKSIDLDAVIPQLPKDESGAVHLLYILPHVMTLEEFSAGKADLGEQLTPDTLYSIRGYSDDPNEEEIARIEAASRISVSQLQYVHACLNLVWQGRNQVIVRQALDDYLSVNRLMVSRQTINLVDGISYNEKVDHISSMTFRSLKGFFNLSNKNIVEHAEIRRGQQEVREGLARIDEKLARQQEALDRQGEALARQDEALERQGEALEGLQQGIDENQDMLDRQTVELAATEEAINALTAEMDENERALDEAAFPGFTRFVGFASSASGLNMVAQTASLGASAVCYAGSALMNGLNETPESQERLIQRRQQVEQGYREWCSILQEDGVALTAGKVGLAAGFFFLSRPVQRAPWLGLL